MRKFSEHGTILNRNKRNSSRSITQRTEGNIERVRQLIEESPHWPVRRNGTRLCQSSFHRISKNDIRAHPYKIQMKHQLLGPDFAGRTTFCNWLLEHGPRFIDTTRLLWLTSLPSAWMDVWTPETQGTGPLTLQMEIFLRKVSVEIKSLFGQGSLATEQFCTTVLRRNSKQRELPADVEYFYHSRYSNCVWQSLWTSLVHARWSTCAPKDYRHQQITGSFCYESNRTRVPHWMATEKSFNSPPPSLEALQQEFDAPEGGSWHGLKSCGSHAAQSQHLSSMQCNCRGSTTVTYLFLARFYCSVVLRSNNALYWTSLLFPY